MLECIVLPCFLLSMVCQNCCIKELQPPPSKRLRVRLAAGSVCIVCIKFSYIFLMGHFYYLVIDMHSFY